MNDWSLQQVWNGSLQEDYTLQPRDYLWASELGKPLVDLWYKLRAEPYSNPPNDRSKRKFEAGDIWEWVIQLILQRVGVLQDMQERCEWQYNGLMKVTGKADFKAGGMPDWDSAKAEVEKLLLPESFTRRAFALVEYLQTTFPDGLREKNLEIKSVSSFVYEALERTGRAMGIHRLQAFHYAKCTQRQTDIIYVCRDDCRMLQIPIYPDSVIIEDEYRDYIEKATEALQSDTPPELEKMIKFDEDMCKFSKNNQVAWSGYLTRLYGIESQKEFDDTYTSMATRWNSVLTRVKKGKSMTAKNEQALQEIREAGFDVDTIVAKLTPEEEEE